MTRNWKLQAEALGLGIPDRDLEVVVKALDRVEESFRPLGRGLRLETEPAYKMSIEEDDA